MGHFGDVFLELQRRTRCGVVVGEPNDRALPTSAYGDDGKAWTPKTQDSGIEWLDLKNPRPVYATEVRVRESFNSGTVIKVDVFDDAGVAHTVWAGNDPTTGLNYLLVNFPRRRSRPPA